MYPSILAVFVDTIVVLIHILDDQLGSHYGYSNSLHQGILAYPSFSSVEGRNWLSDAMPSPSKTDFYFSHREINGSPVSNFLASCTIETRTSRSRLHMASFGSWEGSFTCFFTNVFMPLCPGSTKLGSCLLVRSWRFNSCRPNMW